MYCSDWQSETDHFKIINKFTMKQTVSLSPGHPAINDIRHKRYERRQGGRKQGPVKTSEDQSVININLFPVVSGHSGQQDKQNTVVINKDSNLAGTTGVVCWLNSTPLQVLLAARGVSLPPCHCPVGCGCWDQPTARAWSSPVTGFNHQVFVASNYQSALFPNDEQK